MGIRVGDNTVRFDMPPNIIGFSSVAGKDEKNGPYGACFDITFEDSLWGEKTYELAERKMQLKAVETAIEKSGLTTDDINMLIGGDLLNSNHLLGFVARTDGHSVIRVFTARLLHHVRVRCGGAQW